MGAAAGGDTPRGASHGGEVGQRGGKPPDPRQGGQMPVRVTLRPRDADLRLCVRNCLTSICPGPTILHMPWAPGQRATQRNLESPFDDVPEHIRQPLWEWVEHHLNQEPNLMPHAAMTLRVSIPGAAEPDWKRLSALRHLCSDPGFTLDLVEYILEHAGNPASDYLERLLIMGNSAYAVRADDHGLELRTVPAVRDHIQKVVSAATGSAGDHLATAWNSAFSRSPDPSKAYSEAIKAAEAALAPRVTPQNHRQTLGTMIRDVANAPQNFTFAIGNGDRSDGVGMVLAMMRQLWEGQTSRHGGVNPTRTETIEEAQAAISISAALVQWGVTGAFAHL